MSNHEISFSVSSNGFSALEADENDTNAIGVAMTANVRRSPNPNTHSAYPIVPTINSQHSGHFSIPFIRAANTQSDHQSRANRIAHSSQHIPYRRDRRSLSGEELAGSVSRAILSVQPASQLPSISGTPLDQNLRMVAISRRESYIRSASLDAPGVDGGEIVRDAARQGRRPSEISERTASVSSVDSNQTPTRSTIPAQRTPSRSNRKPLISMRRACPIASNTLYEPSDHMDNHPKLEQDGKKNTDMGVLEASWLESPFRLYPTSSVKGQPGVVVQSPTLGFVASGESRHDPGESGTRSFGVTRNEHSTPDDAREAGQRCSRDDSTVPWTLEQSSSIPQGISLPFTAKHNNHGREGLHVAFTEANAGAEAHLRTSSASSETSSGKDLILRHPNKAGLAPPQKTFQDIFPHAIKHLHIDSQNKRAGVAHSSAGQSRRFSRRSSSFGFRRSSRQLSQIGPTGTHIRNNSVPGDHSSRGRPKLLNMQPSAAIDGTEAPTHGRSKSMWEGIPSFRNPFHRQTLSDPEAHLTGGRRNSAPEIRRPSTMRRMSSMVVPENPVPKRYRTRSVSSFAYFVTPLAKNNTTIPIFEENIEEEKENIEEFLAGVELLQAQAVRKPWESKLFKALYFTVILCVIYFVFVGQPIWEGVGLIFYRWIHSKGVGEAGSAIFMSWAAFQAFVPMLGTRFEQEVDDPEQRDASEVALVIPAYKAAKILPETIKAALKIFKPEQIFIIANGNSPTPLDDTADVCKGFGVNVAWVPIGSKITAEFVGVALTKNYKYVMLIDDDVHLPPNLPLVTNRIQGQTKCIGYTIKSTGENGSKGTLIQQCQDMEYKLSGLTRTFCGKYGSSTFPHGAIILWDRATLQSLFNVHPGYVISEDWYFGHAARASGFRIQFCSQVFVETETPPALFKDFGPSRGGYGEMTVFKQRFTRWNFFFAFRIWEDAVYILCSWRLGWREIVTKIWVLVEVYDSIMAFLRPFVVVLSFMVNWRLLLIFIAGLMGIYILAFSTFNLWHLRKKNEMIAWKVLPVYMGMKFLLLWVNVISVYWDVYCYAKYFSVKHPRVIETRKVLEAAYQARLGSNLVPLTAKFGDTVTEDDASQTEKPDADLMAHAENERRHTGHGIFSNTDNMFGPRTLTATVEDEEEEDEPPTFAGGHAEKGVTAAY